MKKILIALLLLAGSANAGQFLETFSEVRAQARAKLNINSTSAYLTDSTANQYIREGMLFVNPMMMYDKEVKATVTTFKQNTYTLDTMFVGLISIEMSKNDSVKTLKYVPRGQWYEQYVEKTTGKTGYDKWPSFYDYSDDQLFLYPTPTRAGDTVKMYGWQKVGDVDTVSTLTKVPEKYRLAVMFYVAYAAADARSDMKAQRLFQLFEAAMQSAVAYYERGGAASAKASDR